MTGRVHILLVANDLVEVQALPFVADGPRALDRLRAQTAGELGWPLLTLLALDLPQTGSLEFLQGLRADPVLTPHIVFWLVTAAATSDRQDPASAASEHHLAGSYVAGRLQGYQSVLVELLQAA
jgi:CheY-like chemotaxis protein